MVSQVYHVRRSTWNETLGMAKCAFECLELGPGEPEPIPKPIEEVKDSLSEAAGSEAVIQEGNEEGSSPDATEKMEGDVAEAGDATSDAPGDGAKNTDGSVADVAANGEQPNEQTGATENVSGSGIVSGSKFSLKKSQVTLAGEGAEEVNRLQRNRTL